MSKKYLVGIAIFAGFFLIVFLFPPPPLPVQFLPKKPKRIIALTLGTAEILLDLVPKKRIIGMHRFAANRSYSNISEQIEGISLVGTDSEMIISLMPDMIFVASYTGVDLLNQLKAANVPVIKISSFEKIEDIFQNIKTMGHFVGEPSRAKSIVQRALDKIKLIQKKIPRNHSPRRLLVLMKGGWVAGSRTSQNELIRLAGGRNVAAEQGIVNSKRISAEQIITWNPDTILVGKSHNSKNGVKNIILSKRIYAPLRKKKIIEISQSHLTNVSQYIVEGLQDLVEELY